MAYKVFPALLHGGPADGRTVDYHSPMPLILVIAELVPANGSIQPGLRYFDYRMRERVHTRKARGPYHYDYVERP